MDVYGCSMYVYVYVCMRELEREGGWGQRESRAPHGPCCFRFLAPRMSLVCFYFCICAFSSRALGSCGVALKLRSLRIHPPPFVSLRGLLIQTNVLSHAMNKGLGG